MQKEQFVACDELVEVLLDQELAQAVASPGESGSAKGLVAGLFHWIDEV